jgi:hypothetical protein
MKKIDSVKIIHIVDDNPDTSFIGEYTNDLEPGVIVRQYSEFYEKIPTEMERDTDGTFYRKKAPEVDRWYNRGECPTFRPYAGGEKVGTKNYYVYGMQDYNRMEALNNGDFCFLGISAEAKVLTSTDGENWLINTLSSGGLWGIESDGEKSYIKDVEEEELEHLKDVLKEYGFSEEEITEAFKNIKEAD